ncbi:Mobilization protein A [Eubacterium limosum]|uniref:Mobilization protein A n=1 Tax=Eubacterium limosum TaxID=1736 RepID=A0A6N3HCJ4_EUBLI
MAIYHCSISIIKRSEGRSAVATAAYRSGEKLTDERKGITHDYTRKSGVADNGIMLCQNAPSEYADRETLWNAVHEIEKAKNAQLAREIEVALPREFSRTQQIHVLKEYMQEQFVNEGMCADWAIHDKGDGNPHAHILLTMRPIKENGQWGAKERKAYALDAEGQRIPIIDPETGQQKVDRRNCRQWQRVTVQANDWNSQDKAEKWRAAWADVCNQYLHPEEQIDHRSYERQGKEQIPTLHEGYVARKMKEKGLIADRCEINRNIVATNEAIKALNDQLEEIQIQIESDKRVIAELQDKKWR